jgi:chemotaxis protein CheC
MLEIQGKCGGEIFLILPRKSADELVRILSGGCELSDEDVAANRISALRETGNILCSAFLNSVAAITDMEVLPSVPSDAEDMAGAIIDIIQIKYAASIDRIYIAESALVRGSTPLELYLLAIFEPDSLVDIVKRSNKYFSEHENEQN